MDDDQRPGIGAEVPGYRLMDTLGIGSGGPVWSAVRAADGLGVAVKVVDPAMTSELAVLRGVDHPHVVRLLADVSLADGRLALVLERVDGGSLARVVAARGHLTAGETVTVLTSLGTALADLHRLGVTHGDLSPGNVLFRADGRPMLSDLGVAGIAGLAGRSAAGTPGFIDPAVLGGEHPGPATDGYALAALGWFCLVGTPPPHPADRPALRAVCPFVPDALAQAIDAALDPDPTRRIDVAELAWRAYDGTAPTPVTLGGGVDPAAELTRRIRAQAVAEPSPPGSRRRRRCARLATAARRVVRLTGPVRAVLALAPVVALVLAVGVVLARPSAPAASAPADPARVASARGAPSWTSVLAALSDARAAAFAQPARGPGGFDLPASPAWRQDQSALDRLHASGVRYAHLAITVGSVRVVAQSGARATLRAVVSTSAYDVVGGPERREPPRAAREVVLSLRRVTGGWRVFAVGGS